MLYKSLPGYHNERLSSYWKVQGILYIDAIK